MFIFTFWHSLTMLALESSDVVRLRLVRVAAGGEPGIRELQLMVAEKIDAALEASANLCSGRPPELVVARYRHYVANNARRLGGADRS